MSSNQYDYGKITLVKGVIETADGNYSEFTIGTDGGWQQWGSSTERLGHTVGAMEAMSRALLEADLLVSDADEPEPEYDLALLVGVHRDHLERARVVIDHRLGLNPEMDGTGWRTWSEPVDEDDNDGVTHLVRIEVESIDQAHHVANFLDNLGLLSDAVTDRDQAAAEEIVGGPCQVMAYVTNRDTYCEGYHRMLVRTGEGPLTEHDLLGK